MADFSVVDSNDDLRRINPAYPDRTTDGYGRVGE